jgi:UBX domain-containing protein 1
VVIKFWKNGLTVDDGPLRALDDPAQKEFLDSINKGIVPMELRERHRALQAQGGLDVSVEDHRTEDFVEPAYRAFSGSGANLGRAAPPAAAVVAKGSGKAAVVDDSKPTTTIQVKLVNGKREKIVLNLTHTVADLQGAVAALGATGGKPFSLSAGFPPKALADPDLTVEAAGLKNASVTQVVA